MQNIPNEIREDMLKVKRLVSEVEMIFGKQEGETELVNKLIDAENLLTYCMSRLENAIVPPCKMCDAVYEVITCKNKANNRIDGHIRSCIVTSIHLSNRYTIKDAPYITLGASGSYLHGGYIKRVPLEVFGTTVFLSREEAERALEEMTSDA